MTTLIIGIGNILRGDDGIGSAVIEALESETLPPKVDLLDAGTPGFEMVLLMQGYERVIFIDAVDMQGKAGEWRWFTPDEVKRGAGDMQLRGTLHYAGLAEALNLGEALDLLPAEIKVLGIQAEIVDWQQKLSPSLEAMIPEACAAILAEVVAHHA
jgi:hydrogenase maturation protease